MRIPTPYVRPLLFKLSAFERARMFYRPFENHPDPEKRLCFEDDVAEYLRFGFVVSRPTVFMMGKIVNAAPENTNLVEPAWFVRIAVGPVEELVNCIPFYLPKVIWCRNNDGKLKEWKIERVYKLAKATGGKHGRR